MSVEDVQWDVICDMLAKIGMVSGITIPELGNVLTELL